MEGVEEVRQLDDKRLFWKAQIAGKVTEWEAEIYEQIPDSPLVLPHVFVLARMRPYLVEQRFAFLERQIENVRVQATTEV